MKPFNLRSLGVALGLHLICASAGAAQPLACSIEPDRIAEIGTPVIGVVESVLVDRGERVRKGQVLATLRADVERASLAVASTRAQTDADVQAALANYEFMRDKHKRSEELSEKNFISRQAVEQARSEMRIAEQKLALARDQQQVAHRERDLAHAQLGMRSIRAPFDGVIADRYVSQGERVEQKALFRMAKVNPLRVELMVPASLYGTVEVGTALEVTPELPKTQPIRAKVVLVDTLMDAPSNTFRARAELANPDARMPSGVRCRAALVGEPAQPVDKVKPKEPAVTEREARTMPAPQPAPVPKPARASEPKKSAERPRLSVRAPATQMPPIRKLPELRHALPAVPRPRELSDERLAVRS